VIQPSLAISGISAMLGVTVSRQQTNRARICGSSRSGKLLGREAYFTLSENPLTRDGIPTNVTCAILLWTEPNGNYTARVRAEAKVNQYIFQTTTSEDADIHFEPVADASGEETGFILSFKQKTT
jgi:hypothetical protein